MSRRPADLPSARAWLGGVLLIAAVLGVVFWVGTSGPPPAPVPGAAPAPVVSVPGQEAQVVRVKDGDTIAVRTNQTPPTVQEESVRILGVDTPELKTQDCYAAEAAAQTRDMLTGTTVTLQTEGPDKDRYQRLLRYVMTDDGRDLSWFLVRYGFARVYTEYPVSRTPDYLTAQAAARLEQRGGWAACGW